MNQKPHNESLAQRLSKIRQEANFHTDQQFIRDGVPLFIFVKHEAFGAAGQKMPSDGSCFPGATKRKDQSNQHNSSAFVKRGEVEDAGIASSSDDEEEINYDDDAEQDVKVHTHCFTVDLVARYPDEADHLLLHWGLSRKQHGAWGSPDPKFYPSGTQNWGDGLACQSPFLKESDNPSIRSMRIQISWVEEVDQPVTSISFVLTEKNKNVWHSLGGKDSVIAFCPNPEPEVTKIDGAPRGKIGEVVSQIIDCEVHKSSWTLMHRYYMCRDLLKSDKVDTKSCDNVVYFYIWLRYSFTKQLSWQRRYNTKPRELQGAQIALTNEICEQYKYNCREQTQDQFLTPADIFRSMVVFIGKGSGNGQAVRDEILHIMHRHGIPETQGHFYEQWHQKLHNNTTPDDIPICEALLAYLKSGGNKSEYWRVLGENGITRERLASYERKITEEPWYKPEAIGSFEHYLHILKQMHSSDDLNQLIDEARRHVGGDTHGLMNDLQRNYKDHDVLRQMDRALNLRQNLVHNHYDHSNTGKLKDIMFLDACLEAYIRKLTEQIMHIDIGFDAYIREVAIILQNLRLSYQWSEIKYCRDDWNVLVQTISKNLHEDNARKVKSVIDRLKSMLGEVNEVFDQVMQKKAQMMGNAFKAQDYAVNLFSEEVLRGTLFFSLSMILKKIDPHVRKCAHLGDWLIISKGRSHGSRGYVEKVPKLYDVMHKTYENRTILLVDKVTGEEEVPSNVQAIVLMNPDDYPDVLAHVSVRARNLKVLLAVNFNDHECKNLSDMIGKHVVMNVKNHIVEWSSMNPNQPIARRASSHLILQEARDTAEMLEPPPMFKKSLMFMDEFNHKNSGAKSNNLRNLRGKLDQNIKLPESASIPFQMCEYSVQLEPIVRQKLESLINKVSTIKSVKKMNKMLYQCKDLIMGLKFHPEDSHHKYLKEQLIKFGIQTAQFDHAWKAIKRVWASKFNERAFLATQKLGVKINQIYMAVLVQRIVTAEYAFVIHTTNPTNGRDEEVYAEACIGLGEALVSDMPGQGMGFSYDKNTQACKIDHYPNKPLGLTASGFIFRSDSNSEDLPGFAGAGLFDSYTMNEEKKFRINYNQEKLLLNDSFKSDFMKKIGFIGHHIEKIYDDDPQDIEGAYMGGDYYVVQTRPQV